MQTPQQPKTVRPVPTPEQRDHLKPTAACDTESLELRVEELEERIAPRLASNHNETLLVDA